MISAIIDELLFIGFKLEVAKDLVIKHLDNVKRGSNGLTVINIVDGIVAAERSVRHFAPEDDFPKEDLQ